MTHPTARRTPAWVFMLLLTPFGASSGYVTVTLVFLLHQAGMSAAAIAVIVSFSLWPQTWKVLWAPIVDTTLNAKTWYVLGAVLTGLTMLGMSLIPANGGTAPLLTLLVIVSSLTSTLVSMSSELFMAHSVEDERKGAVSGWSQAGNLGGAAVGGGLALYLSQHAPAPWISGAAMTVLCAACCAGLLLTDEPVREARRPNYLLALRDVLKDVWSVSRSRPGLLVLILMLLPIGSGGASGLWSAIAGEWRTGPDTVALVTGALGGVASLIGAVGGGYVCDRMDRKAAYCLFGMISAGTAVAMAVLPRTPAYFIVCTLAYGVALGACYAGYSAAVLDAIGKGAAATKFNLMASVSNVPIAVMTAVAGTTHDKFGSSGMLYVEAGAAIAAMALFAVFARLTRNVRVPWNSTRDAVTASAS